MSVKFVVFVLNSLGYNYLMSGFASVFPVVNPVQRSIVTRKGSNVTLVCFGRNVNPLDTMSLWKFKGQEITEGGNKKVRTRWLPGGTGNFSLHITNVSNKDVGQYMCSLSVSNFNKLDVAESFIKLKLYSSVRWPKGTYALPMPVCGCPKSKKALWSEGFLKQNTEDTTPLSNWSRPTHLKGLKKNNVITQHFCVKEKKGGSDEWPAGKYCIYKKGKCPPGFEEGSIKWDDEDTKNDNKASGVLPDGDYGKDTVVHFCCRSDGSADKPIELPMREPFFLLKHSSSCQEVMGMRFTEEWVFWDCEDKENKNVVSGKLPESFVAKDVKLYYCYYIEK